MYYEVNQCIKKTHDYITQHHCGCWCTSYHDTSLEIFIFVCKFIFMQHKVDNFAHQSMYSNNFSMHHVIPSVLLMICIKPCCLAWSHVPSLIWESCQEMWYIMPLALFLDMMILLYMFHSRPHGSVWSTLFPIQTIYIDMCD